MANYDLTYEGSRVQNILDTGDELRDAGYIFRGEATPSTVPGTPTERVAYIGGPGTYTNFGSSITVGAGCICVFKYTGSAWSNQVINTGLSDAISSEASARQLGDSTLQGGINTVSAAITAINNAIGNGCVYAGIATPSSTPASGKVFYFAFTAGTYTNFNSLEVPQGINILKNNGSTWLLDSFSIIDDAPTQGSDNLVKSCGVLNSIIQNGPAFDLSAYNAQGGTLATYADLSAALTALNALPADFKKGGMSFRFVLTSDNKYVQYRLMAQNFSTTVTDWQGVDDEPTAGSNNLVKSGGVIDEIGHFIIYDGQFVYQESGWGQNRILFNKSTGMNIGDHLTVNIVNNTEASISFRVYYSDGTNESKSRNSTGKFEFSKENTTIIGILAYFGSDARPNGYLKVECVYNLYAEIQNIKGNADYAKESSDVFNEVKSDINGTVFVKSSNLKINRFFKELFIEPIWPKEFSIESVNQVSVYRNKDYTTYNRWLIQFLISDSAVCSFDVQESPESNGIISLEDATGSHQRFRAKAVVDWSQLDDGEGIYIAECSLTELCLDIKYSAYIRYNSIALPLIENGYQYKGVIDTNPANTPAVTPKGKEFYIAIGPGTYTSFGNTVLPYGKIGILKYDSQWSMNSINLIPYFGKIDAFDGTISKTAAGSSWESIRRFYNCFSSFGSKAKLTIENNTGSAFICLVGLDGADTQKITISASATEKVINFGYNIKQIYLYFNEDDNPEGTLKVAISCNNYRYIEELSSKIDDISLHQTTRKATGSVSVGGNLLVRVFGDYKAGETHVINISGTVDSTLLLRGIKKDGGSTVELGSIRCNNYCRRTFAYDYSEIRVAKNNMSESGSVTLSVLSDDAWSSINNDNDIRIKSCGLKNTKTFFKSGFDCYAEIPGNFKANKEYQIELSGDAGNNSFYLMLFSLENTEIYRTTGFVTGRTYIFKCPYNAEKITFIKNNISGDVELHAVIKEAAVAKIEKQMPNYIGVPIAAHQGNTAGGQIIGSPKAWLAAQRLGYKWIECDIQFTSDNIAVFLHDQPINKNGNYVVSKADGTPVDKNDNLNVSSFTYRQLKDTYRWADGGEILSLVEGFGLLSMLGMNCVLEFKAYADNDEKREYLKTACLIFGIERIIYNATSTDYRIVFPTLVNLGIYRRGNISLTSSDESDMEAAFAYASQLGNAVASCYALQGGIDSDFAQRMMGKYGVAYVGRWGQKNTKYQTGLIVSDDIAPVKDSYSNKSDLLSNQDVNYNEYTSVGTVTISELSNVNLSMIADENISVKIQTKNYEHYGNANIAYVLPNGTYNVYVNGTGHISELSVRY